MELLKNLTEIPGASGDESRVKEFVLDHISRNIKNWKTRPEVIHGDGFQDCIILRFGRPRTAVFAHLDTVGFTVRYFNQLLPIGSPDADMGTMLVGHDSLGPIACELEYDKENHAFYKFGRQIDRGTVLTYKPNFRETKTWIQSPYLDNRLGVRMALQIAEDLEDGVIVFSTWEEHGGGSVPYLAKYIFEQWGVRQALVSDITWVSDGIQPGKGTVISMRDRNIPRKVFLDRVIRTAQKNKIRFQLEVEGMGSSDGRELQVSPYPFDWCFIGPPQHAPHTPDEKVMKSDIKATIGLYRCLMKSL